MFPSALLMLALDERDGTIIDAFLGLAARLGVQRLTVVHLETRDLLPEAIARSLPQAELAVPPEVQARVDQLRAALPDAVIDVRVEGGSPLTAMEILEAELSPDLVVMGRSAADGDDDAFGTIGRNVLRHFETCTLVVPQGWRGPARGAVVGLDFSDHALVALQDAVQLFEEVVCLYQYDPAHRYAGSMTEVEFTLEVTRNAREHFERDVLPTLGGRGAELEIVGTHRASEALIARADGDRVIVVGSRGLSPFAAMLLGSTAERIAARAGAPVLIVRRKGERMGLVEGLIRR